MSLWSRFFLMLGFLPLGFIFLGAALFFFAWVFAMRSRER
jgi:hypothetical protein